MTPKKAQTILKKHGTIVTIREAKIIVDFLNMLAVISIEIYMKANNNTN